MAETLVSYYDENEVVVGRGSHQQGMDAGHHTANVFTFLVESAHAQPTGRRMGGLVLQRRAGKHYPGQLDITAGGKVEIGRDSDNPETAALHELHEELPGVVVIGGLYKIAKYRHQFAGEGKDNLRRHFTNLYVGVTRTPIESAEPNTAEVQELVICHDMVEVEHTLQSDACVPSLAAEVDRLVDYLTPMAGTADPFVWAAAHLEEKLNS